MAFAFRTEKSTTKAYACYLLYGGLLFGLFFDPELEATCLFSMSADFHRNIYPFIPEDRNSL
jgi:hypothetical protein